MVLFKSQKIWPSLLIIALTFFLNFGIQGSNQVLAAEIDRIQLREDFQEYLYDFDNDELQEVFTSEYLEKLTVDGPKDLIDRQKYITIEEAIADTEFLI